MPKTLNLTNLTQPPETEGNPWSALLSDTAQSSVSADAAHKALTTLLPTWQDDGGTNRTYVLTTLEDTIKALSQFYWGLKVAFDYETFSANNRVLAERMVDGTITRADLDDLSRLVEALNTLKAACGLTDVAPALIEAAFALGQE